MSPYPPRGDAARRTALVDDRAAARNGAEQRLEPGARGGGAQRVGLGRLVEEGVCGERLELERLLGDDGRGHVAMVTRRPDGILRGELAAPRPRAALERRGVPEPALQLDGRH